MRFVTRAELLKEPKGTIFFAYFPASPCSIELMRFDGEYNGDFLESTIGPHWTGQSYNKEKPYDHFSIDTDNGREGMFDDNQVYVVLDQIDVDAVIAALQNKDPEQQILRLF